jgi:Zinc finger C-x8-C-x5-C-x3-H type (and similar)
MSPAVKTLQYTKNPVHLLSFVLFPSKLLFYPCVLNFDLYPQSHSLSLFNNTCSVLLLLLPPPSPLSLSRSSMDAYEATRVLFSRIQALDPENASKIMGLLLIQDHGEKEMIRLALGPESLLQSLILKSRKELNLSSSPPPPAFNTSPRLLPSPTSWASSPQPFSRANNGSLEEAPPCSEDIYGDVLEEQGLGLYPEAMAGWGGGLGWKPCLYFARGYCKNGVSCRFLHDEKLDAATAAAVSLEQEILLRSKSQSPRPSQLMASAFPYSPTGKGGVGFLFQQQADNQRYTSLSLSLFPSCLCVSWKRCNLFIVTERQLLRQC